MFLKYMCLCQSSINFQLYKQLIGKKNKALPFLNPVTKYNCTLLLYIIVHIVYASYIWLKSIH